ncbi:MAG: hypothetical protein WC616_01595 [Candidatus Omnitrophota bacterium]
MKTKIRDEVWEDYETHELGNMRDPEVQRGTASTARTARTASTGIKKDPSSISARRLEFRRLYDLGHTISEIALKLGCHVVTVHGYHRILIKNNP